VHASARGRCGKRLQDRFHAPSAGAFDLLAEIARHLEVAGGLRFPGFDREDFRISLAGGGVDRLPLQKLKMAMAVCDALPPDFPGEIAESIFDGMERAARRLTD
jgi:hypothetical protein